MEKVMKFVLFLAAITIAAAKPALINDAATVSSFSEGVGAFADKGEYSTAEELSEQAKAAPATVTGLSLSTSSPKSADSATYMIGSVYKCGKCDHWHPGGIASAWALTSDGVMVTNYHVFEKAKGAVMGVCDQRGNAYAITEVLAASETDDIAIFRTTAKDIPAFPLGPVAEVGSFVQVISHPKQRFYTHTTGIVSRYHLRPNKNDAKPTTWMSITADYAAGSSGGPVLDRKKRIIGMVSNTQSIYYNSEPGKEPKGPLQMVVKNCVPVSAIKAMTNKKSPAKKETATS
jgi:serine protease Do